MKGRISTAITLAVPLALSLASFPDAAQYSLVGAVGYFTHKLTHILALEFNKKRV